MITSRWILPLVSKYVQDLLCNPTHPMLSSWSPSHLKLPSHFLTNPLKAHHHFTCKQLSTQWLSDFFLNHWINHIILIILFSMVCWTRETQYKPLRIAIKFSIVGTVHLTKRLCTSFIYAWYLLRSVSGDIKKLMQTLGHPRNYLSSVRISTTKLQPRVHTDDLIFLSLRYYF